MPSGCSPAFYVESNAVATVAPTVGNTVASTAEGTPEATATPTNGEDADSPWIGHLETKEPCDSTISFDVGSLHFSPRGKGFLTRIGEKGGRICSLSSSYRITYPQSEQTGEMLTFCMLFVVLSKPLPMRPREDEV